MSDRYDLEPDFYGGVEQDYEVHGGIRGMIQQNQTLFTILAVVAAFGLLAGVFWLGQKASNSAGGYDQDVPLIQADGAAYKVRPTDPGGMDIPYQNSTVFDAMTTDEQGGAQNNENGDEQTAEAEDGEKVEDLFALTDDKPMTKDSMFAGLKAEPSPEAEAALSAPITEDSEASSEKIKEETAQPEPKPAPKEEPKAQEKPKDVAKPAPAPAPVKATPKPEPKAEAKPKPAPTPQPQSTGGYFVQLASVPDASRVDERWAELKGEFGSLISNLAYRTQSANIPGKGTYHRIQVGPYSKSAAETLCGKIKAKNPQGCLVVKG